MFSKLPNDPWFENLDPILHLWMYQSWIKDLEEKNEFARSYAILGGSFVNPDMAKQMIKHDNPDHEVSDADFEKISKEILENNEKENKLSYHSRRRRVVKNNNINGS